MKKLLTASLVAIMAVTAARAEIASTGYVNDQTGANADGNIVFESTLIKDMNLSQAVEKLAGEIGTGGSVSDQIDGKIETALGDIPADKTVAQAISDAQTAAVTTAGSNADAKITAAKQAMNLNKTGGDNLYIKSVTQTDGAVTAEIGTIDTKVTASSTNLITSGAVATEIAAANTEVTNLKKTVAANTAGIDGLINGDNSVSAQIEAAKTEINTTIQNMNSADVEGSVANKIQTVETNLGAVTSANMGTDANTVVGAIKEVVTEAAAAQTAANKAQGEVDALEGVVSQLDTDLTSAIGTAKGEAIDAAAADATSKADAALASAKTYAEQQAAAAKSGAEKTATDAIAALDANQETTGVNDGSYVTSVAQQDGKITVSTVAFDSVLNANSTNAVQNMVVKAALDTKANDSDLSAVAKLALPTQCANGAATCALVYDPTAEGKLKWESIMK